MQHLFSPLRLFYCLVFFSSTTLLAQGNDITVEASDGVYPNYVLVKWNPVPNATAYKVFRSAFDDGTMPEQLTEWKQSTWLNDYGAKENKKYSYSVKAKMADKNISDLSVADKGHVKVVDYAHDDELLTSNDDLFAEKRRRFLEIITVTLDEAKIEAGGSVEVVYSLNNTYSTDLPETHVRFYLSADEALDWEDTFVDSKTMNSFPASGTMENSMEIEVPDDTAAGNYYLLVVTSVNGEVTNSRVNSVAFTVE